MAKLKNIIKQLSEKDFKAIYDSLIESNAEKSAYLLRSLRERQLSDNKIMTELDVNANAYYTLRSRLNLKIEEFLMGQLESPRTDVLRKVANINEVLFTKKEGNIRSYPQKARKRAPRLRPGKRAHRNLQVSQETEHQLAGLFSILTALQPPRSLYAGR